jgi:hypothetical protein
MRNSFVFHTAKEVDVRPEDGIVLDTLRHSRLDVTETAGL